MRQCTCHRDCPRRGKSPSRTPRRCHGSYPADHEGFTKNNFVTKPKMEATERFVAQFILAVYRALGILQYTDEFGTGAPRNWDRADLGRRHCRVEVGRWRLWGAWISRTECIVAARAGTNHLVACTNNNCRDALELTPARNNVCKIAHQLLLTTSQEVKRPDDETPPQYRHTDAHRTNKYQQKKKNGYGRDWSRFRIHCWKLGEARGEVVQTAPTRLRADGAWPRLGNQPTAAIGLGPSMTTRYY